MPDDRIAPHARTHSHHEIVPKDILAIRQSADNCQQQSAEAIAFGLEWESRERVNVRTCDRERPEPHGERNASRGVGSWRRMLHSLARRRVQRDRMRMLRKVRVCIV